MNKKDYDALYETICLLTKPEVTRKIKAGEKEKLKKMKTYNSRENW